MPSQEHIYKKYDQELEKLRSQVEKMGNEVSHQLELLRSHLDSDEAKLALDDVIDGDLTINNLETKASRTVLKILARRAPVGRDLRFVIASSRIVSDLERIGDEIKTIARSLDESGSQLLCDEEDIQITLSDMLTMAMNLLNKAQLAALNEDAETAHQMLNESLSETGTYKTRFQQVMECMKKNQQSTFSAGFDSAFQTHSLKRICDHVCNICEHIVFLTEGEDIRHADD